jgi:hypothetical protein
MRERWRVFSLLLPLWAASACTQDFSAFHFDQSRSRNPATVTPDGGTAGKSADQTTSGIGSGQPTPIPTGTRGDAGKPAVPAISGDAGGGSRPPIDMTMPDSNMPQPEPDAAMDDDAGVPAELVSQQCVAEWPRQQGDGPLCRLCACSACDEPILDCLNRGDEHQRSLCRDVLMCALRNHCQARDCYCDNDGCGAPSASGNGACAAEIDAASGGKRSKFTSVRNAIPPNLDEPLVRAIQAIACLYGTDDTMAGPPVTESCMTTCG